MPERLGSSAGRKNLESGRARIFENTPPFPVLRSLWSNGPIGGFLISELAHTPTNTVVLMGPPGAGKSTIIGEISLFKPIEYVSFDNALHTVLQRHHQTQQDVRSFNEASWQEVDQVMIDDYQAKLPKAQEKTRFVFVESTGVLGHGLGLAQFLKENYPDTFLLLLINPDPKIHDLELGMRHMIQDTPPQTVISEVEWKYHVFFPNIPHNDHGGWLLKRIYSMSALPESFLWFNDQIRNNVESFINSNPSLAATLMRYYTLPPRDDYHHHRKTDELPWSKSAAYFHHLLYHEWKFEPFQAGVVFNQFSDHMIQKRLLGVLGQ